MHLLSRRAQEQPCVSLNNRLKARAMWAVLLREGGAEHGAGGKFGAGREKLTRD